MGARKQLRVLICDPIASAGESLLRREAQVDTVNGLSKDELIDRIGAYEVVIVRSKTRLDADVIRAGKRLRVVGRAGIGVDNIDVEAASRLGIVVVNAPNAPIVAAAEHTMALMLSMTRRLPAADAAVKAGQWGQYRHVGTELRGKTLGLIGLGQIGSAVARRAEAMQMNVIAFDPFVGPDYAARHSASLVTLDELLAEADVVSLHAPLTSETANMINGERLEKMKPTSFLINCARGGLIDEVALCEALKKRRIAMAAIDVFVEEPPVDSPLLNEPSIHDRLVLTPHLGASTLEAQAEAAIEIAEQVLAVLRGEAASAAVNAPAIAPEMIGRLGTYATLAETMARILAQLGDVGSVNELEITYQGEIAEEDTALLKASAVAGWLRSATPERVNLMNSLILARNRGLQVTERHTSTPAEGYTNMITVRAVGRDRFFSSLSGTLYHNQPYLAGVNDYRVDVRLNASNFLFCSHKDRPGVIGKIGTLLGQADVNISYMQVGRQAPRGEALMVLGLDEPVSEDLLRTLVQTVDLQTTRVARIDG